jgi:hypothetical protein
MREILEETVKEYEPALDIKDLLWDTSTSLDVTGGDVSKIHLVKTNY